MTWIIQSCYSMVQCIWLHLAQQWQKSLQWRHNERAVISNHRLLDCLLNRLFRYRSKETSKFHIICLCEGNSRVTSEFLAPRCSNAENVSIWWRHHENIDITLQWSHMRVMSSQITSKLHNLINHLFRHTLKKTKLHITNLFKGNLPVTDGFPSQRASDFENVSMSWRHQGIFNLKKSPFLTRPAMNIAVNKIDI